MADPHGRELLADQCRSPSAGRPAGADPYTKLVYLHAVQTFGQRHGPRRALPVRGSDLRAAWFRHATDAQLTRISPDLLTFPRSGDHTPATHKAARGACRLRRGPVSHAHAAQEPARRG